jgi:hypothetical protein
LAAVCQNKSCSGVTMDKNENGLSIKKKKKSDYIKMGGQDVITPNDQSQPVPRL